MLTSQPIADRHPGTDDLSTWNSSASGTGPDATARVDANRERELAEANKAPASPRATTVIERVPSGISKSIVADSPELSIVVVSRISRAGDELEPPQADAKIRAETRARTQRESPDTPAKSTAS